MLVTMDSMPVAHLIYGLCALFADRDLGETFNVCGDCFVLCASLGDDCTQRKVYNLSVGPSCFWLSILTY